MGQRPKLAAFLSSREFYVGIVLLGIVAAVFWASRAYPFVPWSMGGPPGFYPRFLAVILAALVVFMAIEAFRNPTPLTRPPSDFAIRVALAFGLFFSASLLLLPLGFRLTAGLVSLGLMLIIIDRPSVTPKSVAIMVVTAFGISLLLAFVFQDLAGRRLPYGAVFS